VLPIDINITQEMIKFSNSSQINENSRKITIGRIFTFILFGVLLLLAILGSYYDGKKTQGLATVLSWFSIRKNACEILYSENSVDKNLDILNGVRVLSIGWVVLGHSLFMHSMAPSLNIFDLLKSS